ncbi:hypothetical protein C0992_001616 [Termitomyces sp. T32_za158]|nr:hypothetical protein C0992_001616 [Termitomyces sp. T32_za158]
MLGLTALQSRYTPYKPSNSEEFCSASRSIKLGLIASGIVSAWTTAATLVKNSIKSSEIFPPNQAIQLQSSAVAYKYGISGPWWYGVGATVQVLLFAQLAAKLKLNAPNAHTWLEIVGERWGTLAHIVFLFFGLATNIINSSLIILGGSATVTDLTGMSTIAYAHNITPLHRPHLHLYRVLYEPQDWEHLRNAQAPVQRIQSGPSARQCWWLVPHYALQERSDLWRHQYNR